MSGLDQAHWPFQRLRCLELWRGCSMKMKIRFRSRMAGLWRSVGCCDIIQTKTRKAEDAYLDKVIDSGDLWGGLFMVCDTRKDFAVEGNRNEVSLRLASEAWVRCSWHASTMESMGSTGIVFQTAVGRVRLNPTSSLVSACNGSRLALEGGESLPGRLVSAVSSMKSWHLKRLAGTCDWGCNSRKWH